MAELSDGQPSLDREERTADGSSDYTLVTFGTPGEEFALQDTLSALPAAEFECDRAVRTPDRSVMPLVRVRGVERTGLEPALEADSSVRRAAPLEDSGGETLFRTQWASRLRLLPTMLAVGDSLSRDGHGTSSGWALRVLYSAHSHLSEVRALCECLDVAVTVDSIRPLSGGREDHDGLARNRLEAWLWHGRWDTSRYRGASTSTRSRRNWD